MTDLMHELRIRHTADILSAVRSLRINKDSNKLVENLQKLMLDCTPVDEVKEMPSCK